MFRNIWEASADPTKQVFKLRPYSLMISMIPDQNQWFSAPPHFPTPYLPPPPLLNPKLATAMGNNAEIDGFAATINLEAQLQASLPDYLPLLYH